MGQVRVYLGLGSNLNDREENLRRAVDLLGCAVEMERTSSIYETEPWGWVDQPWFLNCVCAGSTLLEPLELLRAVKEVERSVGREPTFPNGPRVVDVDILFYGRDVVRAPELEIPHTRLAERAFVLVPLEEIAADYVHPVIDVTVAELAQLLGRSGAQEAGLPPVVRLWGPPILAHRLSPSRHI